MEALCVTSPAFEDGGVIPRQYTGYGEDRSPALYLTHLSPDVVSLAVLLDDLDVPFVPIYSHWLIWNLPRLDVIPEGLPTGDLTLYGARQGIGYGRHRYRGPKPPFFERRFHRYRFDCYGLDTQLSLEDGRRRDLLKAMDGHILQQGALTGLYRWGVGGKQ